MSFERERLRYKGSLQGQLRPLQFGFVVVFTLWLFLTGVFGFSVVSGMLLAILVLICVAIAENRYRYWRA